MLFNSFSFLIFLLVVLSVSRLRLPWSIRKGFLLIMSYSFYAAWNPPFVTLLWISTIADWFLAKWMHRSARPAVRNLCLVGTLTVNLGLLAVFKYSSFLFDNIRMLGALGGWDLGLPDVQLILPVGISFYTFQTLSYTLCGLTAEVQQVVQRKGHRELAPLD